MYIHRYHRLTAQGSTFGTPEEKAEGNVLYVREPAYKNIPAGILRRMGKAARIAVGTSLPILEEPVAGIVIGTANGGMEDSVRFLDQVVTYEEGLLTPTNFVQSTSNAIASQIALMARNQGYNITHTQRGLAFENALLDAMMLVQEHPGKLFLVGGVDEISAYNFNIDRLRGCFKREEAEASALYASTTAGSIAGEGCGMFIVSSVSEGAILNVKAIETLDTENIAEVEERTRQFRKLIPGDVDVLISGENGDVRLKLLYERQAGILDAATVVRYKHLTGEYATAAAIALSIACDCASGIDLPLHMIAERSAGLKRPMNLVICNTFEGRQHSLIHLAASTRN